MKREERTVLFSAFRYALIYGGCGVKDVTNALYSNWYRLPDIYRVLIKEEITIAKINRLIEPEDIQYWNKLLNLTEYIK